MLIDVLRSLLYLMPVLFFEHSMLVKSRHVTKVNGRLIGGA